LRDAVRDERVDAERREHDRADVAKPASSTTTNRLGDATLSMSSWISLQRPLAATGATGSSAARADVERWDNGSDVRSTRSTPDAKYCVNGKYTSPVNALSSVV
jgi:PKD repeat protein